MAGGEGNEMATQQITWIRQVPGRPDASRSERPAAPAPSAWALFLTTFVLAGRGEQVDDLWEA